MKKIKERLVNLWNYFTTYEKVWFFSIYLLFFSQKKMLMV